MDLRLEKARTIVKTAKLRRRGDAWLVPSQSGHGKGYVVTHTDTGYACTCPDYEHRHQPCKHVLAVAIVVTTEEVEETRTERTEEVKPDGSATVKTVTTVATTKRTTYKQEWTAYNKAQTEEKATFLTLLHDLCAGVDEPAQHMGRPRLPQAERLFAACYQTSFAAYTLVGNCVQSRPLDTHGTDCVVLKNSVARRERATAGR